MKPTPKRTMYRLHTCLNLPQRGQGWTMRHGFDMSTTSVRPQNWTSTRGRRGRNSQVTADRCTELSSAGKKIKTHIFYEG